MRKYSQSYITKKSVCQGFESKQVGCAAEEGVILHQYFSDEKIEEKEGVKGSIYRDNFQPFNFDHDFKKLEAEALDFKKNNNQWFGENWNYEKELNADLTIHDVSEKITGILDRLKIEDKKAIIADFKTGQQEVNVLDINSIFQSILYSYLVFKNYIDVKEVKFIWIYTRKNGYLKEVKFKRSDLDFITSHIYFKIKLTKEVGLKKSYLCSFCDKSTTCPIIVKEINKIITDDEKADYKTCLLLEGVLKKRKEEIKKEHENDSSFYSVSNSYYVNIKDINLEQFDIIKEKMKDMRITKKELELFKENGFNIEERKSRKFNFRRL